MRPQDDIQLKWVGVDLHVHTPASSDYQGNKDSSEYLRILRSANEFGKIRESRTRQRSGNSGNPIGCVVFTDHNSIDGFRKIRELQEETDRLLKAVKVRDSNNPLTPQLEADLEVLRSIRVLMGVELKADPGIHLLAVFAEATEPQDVVSFLEEAYQQPYSNFAGDPKPTARWTLKETLDRLQARFGDNAFVVFPHVDSSGGVIEDLKEFAAVKIAALTHPIVKALQFNKEETRQKLISLFSQPDYRRNSPLAYVQSSDFHGLEGASIGQPRTDILVREGKSTYKNLREALRERRVKCSVDFVVDEYRDLTEGAIVTKFEGINGGLQFVEQDHNRIRELLCAISNSGQGIIEIEGSIDSGKELDAAWNSIRKQIMEIAAGKVQPAPRLLAHRTLRMSPGKARVLTRLTRSDRLHTLDGKVFIMNGDSAHVASPTEIEAIVSRNMNRRFGSRFEDTLRRVSRNSTLLSRLPRGIALFLGCQTEVDLGLPESFKVEDLTVSTKSNEDTETFSDFCERQEETFPFGDPDGNATLLIKSQTPRTRHHYMRYTVQRAKVPEDLLTKFSCGRVDAPGLLVSFGGSTGLVEPGHIVSDIPALLVRVDGDWLSHIEGLLAWMKSSFFLWYSAVHLGTVSTFMDFQFRPKLIPIPKKTDQAALAKLSEYAWKIIAEEKSFMSEINRLKRKGDLDSQHKEKLRQRHNASAAKISLALDKEIFRFLGLSVSDQRSIAATMRDLNMTDFGLQEELEEKPD